MILILMTTQLGIGLIMIPHAVSHSGALFFIFLALLISVFQYYSHEALLYCR